MSSTAVQLVFAGEILAGFPQAQVREKLGRRLRLDEQRLNKLFSGQRVVIKRDLSPAEAADWVQRFRAIGAVLHAIPAKPPGVQAPLSTTPKAPPSAPLSPPPASAVKTPTPPPPARPNSTPPPDSSMMLSLVPDSELPPPPPPPRALAPSRASAPVAAAPASGPEEVTCPNCGERQSKRVICRSCLCDMPRTLASQKAEAEVRRQARLEEQRARNEQRLAQERAQQAEEDDSQVWGETPPLLSLSTEGRMGRLRYFSINTVGMTLAVIALVLTFSFVLVRPTPATLVPMGLAGLVLSLWGLRVAALRLHDFGQSGWWALLMFVPALNVLFGLAMVFWPGDRDENDYGSPVDDGRWRWALLGLVILGASAALSSPRIMGSVLKAFA